MELLNSKNLNALENAGFQKKAVVPCEVYSRVVGYFRPVNNWNAGKKQEFKDRKEFTEEHSLANPKAQLDVQQEVTLESPKVECTVDTLSSISAYKIFTFPHCDKCEAVKAYLKTHPMAGAIVDLKSPEGNKEFRKYYSDRSIKEKIKRMDDGTLKLPVVMFMDKENVVSTAQSLEEVQQIVA